MPIGEKDLDSVHIQVAGENEEASATLGTEAREDHSESEKWPVSDSKNADAFPQQRTSDYDLTSTIPEETLLLIFQHALPPAFAVSFATTLPPFPRTASSDTSTKLSIGRVCKRWHSVGLELLYENVTLRWIGQLPAFVQALETREEVGSFVRRLEIGYWFPQGYHTLQDAELGKIFGLCPLLTHFAFNPQSLPGIVSAFPLDPFRRLGTITHLELGMRAKYIEVLPALTELCSTLVSLSISLPDSYDNHPTLTFARLESLRAGINPPSRLPGTHWVLPNLQRLLIHFGGGNAFLYNVTACDFLAEYGRRLRVFSARAFPPPTSISLSFQDVLERCPVLQHLSIAETTPNDVVRSAEALEERSREEFEALKSSYPQLRTCRYTRAHFDLFPELPPNGGTDHGLPQSSYLEFLFSEACAGDDSGDDSDYVFDSEDDDDGSVEDSDSDSDSDNSIDYYDFLRHRGTAPSLSSDDEDFEADREQVLEIFRGTLIG
ncbi:hypothetical protein C8R45DRAFT_1031356 [Mycena sanguinolenta]|nr:hypothetical protein C8R45DRAFT_1031356 [Mycena sanguinolenta]